ncbi:MAG: sigma-54 interaction domain-containing protein [Sphingomonadales bacterium]
MRLLIIGNLNGQLSEATKIAMGRGAKVFHSPDVDSALVSLRAGNGADLAMIDVGADIKGFIERTDAERIFVPVVACGVGSNTKAAVAAIRAGAKEYLPLPPDPELIAAVLEAVAYDDHPLLYRDPAMARVVKLADQVAESEANILITGESGTGKEVLARYVHRKSRREGKSFVSVNCAAIPENLLESELFGHEKGAFTGAIARRIGKFEEADGGTLLLDEISEMGVRLQAKLLRAIQEREIDRVGGTKPVHVNIRVLATSNRDLSEEVKKGDFREDLLFRLNVVNLRIPALRERPEDIRMLAEHFAKKYAEANGVPARPLAESTVQHLRGQHWKGNVRELENTIHRAILLASGDEILPEAILLPDGSRHESPEAVDSHNPYAQSQPETQNASALIGRTVAEMERELILDTLRHYLGNRTHAANILGISIRTLRNKLKQYGEEGITVPMPGEPPQATL